jgi:hypothetical protein
VGECQDALIYCLRPSDLLSGTAMACSTQQSRGQRIPRSVEPSILDPLCNLCTRKASAS